MNKWCGTTRRRWFRQAGLTLGALMAPVWSEAVGQRDAGEGRQRLLRRLGETYTATINPSGADAYLQSQSDDGRWPDVDLGSTRNPDWPPLEHMVRLRVLAAAWGSKRHRLAGAAIALMAIERGLAAWLRGQPRSVNWWFNSIGPQLALMPVLVLTRDHMDPDLARRGRSLLVGPEEVPQAQARGQNLIWYGTQWLVRGALASDDAQIAAASSRLQAELAVGGPEGIQQDHSFHQHGPQLYTGGYGLAFLMDSAQLATWLADTPWAYSTGSLQTLVEYALHGVRPLIRGGWLDWGARGREFTRVQHRSRPAVLLPAIERLQALVTERNRELVAFATYLARDAADGGTAPVVENRHYWRSDFMVHQRAAVYYSVKASSERTVGTESSHGENLMGFWTAHGCSYVLRRGDEYDALPPAWDWSRLPGTTASAEVPRFDGLLRHRAKFVGAVSDGSVGAMVMRLDTPYATGRKAWFFDGDTMVALGCDIGSEREQRIATTLNQTRLHGVPTVDRNPVFRDSETNGRHCWHDGMHYLSLDDQPLKVRRHERRGDGRQINAALGGGEVQAELVLITVEHGLRPRNARYAYALWPGSRSESPAAASRLPPLLINEPAMQALRQTPGGPLMAVLHEAGDVALDGESSLKASAPCLLIVQRVGEHWRIHVADPSTTVRRLTLTLRYRGVVLRTALVEMPSDRGQVGRTISCEDMPAR